jgi:hypothetical protein
MMWIPGSMASELPDADSAMSRSIRFDEPAWRRQRLCCAARGVIPVSNGAIQKYQV